MSWRTGMEACHAVIGNVNARAHIFRGDSFLHTALMCAGGKTYVRMHVRMHVLMLALNGWTLN